MQHTLLILIFSLAISGCATSPSPPSFNQLEPLTQSDRQNLSALMSAYKKWQGAPYRLGGNSHSGIDCSAFSQQIYRSVYNRHIPRTTASQHSLGDTIKMNQLKPGDLVFFRPDSKGRHVGIYLTSGQFMHASTSVGVTISNLSNPWWQSVYWKSIRP